MKSIEEIVKSISRTISPKKFLTATALGLYATLAPLSGIADQPLNFSKHGDVYRAFVRDDSLKGRIHDATGLENADSVDWIDENKNGKIDTDDRFVVHYDAGKEKKISAFSELVSISVLEPSSKASHVSTAAAPKPKKSSNPHAIKKKISGGDHARIDVKHQASYTYVPARTHPPKEKFDSHFDNNVAAISGEGKDIFACNLPEGQYWIGRRPTLLTPSEGEFDVTLGGAEGQGGVQCISLSRQGAASFIRAREKEGSTAYLIKTNNQALIVSPSAAVSVDALDTTAPVRVVFVPTRAQEQKTEVPVAVPQGMPYTAPAPATTPAIESATPAPVLPLPATSAPQEATAAVGIASQATYSLSATDLEGIVLQRAWPSEFRAGYGQRNEDETYIEGDGNNGITAIRDAVINGPYASAALRAGNFLLSASGSKMQGDNGTVDGSISQRGQTAPIGGKFSYVVKDFNGQAAFIFNLGKSTDVGQQIDVTSTSFPREVTMPASERSAPHFHGFELQGTKEIDGRQYLEFAGPVEISLAGRRGENERTRSVYVDPKTMSIEFFRNRDVLTGDETGILRLQHETDFTRAFEDDLESRLSAAGISARNPSASRLDLTLGGDYSWSNLSIPQGYISSQGRNSTLVNEADETTISGALGLKYTRVRPSQVLTAYGLALNGTVGTTTRNETQAPDQRTQLLGESVEVSADAFADVADSVRFSTGAYYISDSRKSNGPVPLEYDPTATGLRGNLQLRLLGRQGGPGLFLEGGVDQDNMTYTTSVESLRGNNNISTTDNTKRIYYAGIRGEF